MEMQGRIAVLVGLFCIAVEGGLYAEAAVSCGQVQVGLAPCLNFLQGRAQLDQARCCPAVRSVVNSAKTVLDRRATCRCLVSAAKSMGKSINLGNAAALPGRCGVRIPFPISPNIDCARIG